jgi:hypothetical protein
MGVKFSEDFYSRSLISRFIYNRKNREIKGPEVNKWADINKTNQAKKQKEMKEKIMIK